MGRVKFIFRKFLLDKLYSRLWVKLAVVLTVIFCIPVLFLGIFLVNGSAHALKNSLLIDRKDTAVRVAREVELFIRHSEDILKTSAAMLEDVYADPWRQETVLVSAVLKNPVFMRISSFDLAGAKIATSDLGREFPKEYAQDTLKYILEDKIYISEVSFNKHNRIPYLTMGVPLKVKGKASGALVADIDSRSLWKIVDDVQLDNTGRAFLVSSGGRLIAHPDKKRVLKDEVMAGQRDVDAVLSGKSGATLLEGQDGKRWFGAYAPVPGTGWGVVLRQQEQEAFLFSRVMRWQAVIIIILIEVIAILSAVLIARAFANPIRFLVSKVKGEPFRDQDHAINIKRHDEIGELIKAFNELAEKMKKAKAREKFSSVGEAAMWVAHELKNSLAPIKSFIQLLPSKHKDYTFIDKFSNIVPEEIRRCERMLKDLSEFSLSPELRMDRLDIKDVLESVLEITQDKFMERGIKVQFYATHNDFHILGDQEKLKQVFINLFNNAVDAMPDGGHLNISMILIRPSPEVRDPSASRPQDDPLSGGKIFRGVSYIDVSIRDTGMGIPEEKLVNIFEPFKTTKKEGMGLGLAISRRIVEEHGGKISVESSVGKGALFSIRFPAARTGHKEIYNI